jgi:tight adherence protein C
MNLTVILGAVALVSAVGLLWWGLTARPSAARANLFAGLSSQPAGPPSRATSIVRQVGQATRRLLPNPLVDGLEVNLVQAGHPHGLDLPRILGIKITLAGLAAAAALLLVGQPVIALVVAAVMFFLPDYWVVSVRDQRQAAVQADAADTIDQLTICVEAGLGFDAALARVATTTDGPLADELRHTISDLQAGVPRAQALRALSDRAQVVEIRQLVTALLQAQKHGVPMAETLRIQSSEMRLKRKQRTEEKAAKLTVKMLFPIILCFLPVFMIITMVPAVLSIFRAL